MTAKTLFEIKYPQDGCETRKSKMNYISKRGPTRHKSNNKHESTATTVKLP